jgi:hypothetical protein
VSERLDLVRLIDAKVRVAHVTAARSKTVAILAEEDLADHRRWFEKQRQETEATLKKHASRLERERAAEARRERRQKFVAEAKSVGGGVRRGTVSGFTQVGAGFAHAADVLWGGVARSAALMRSGLSASGSFMCSEVTKVGTALRSGVAAVGRALLALWPPLMAASAMSWLGANTEAATMRAATQSERIGSQLRQWLSARGTAVVETARQELGRQVEGARERRKRMAPAVISERTRQRLQKRIHTLDRASDVRLEPILDEWQTFRARARKVQQELAMRQRGIAWGEDGASRAGTTLWRREPQFGAPQLPVPAPSPRRRRVNYAGASPAPGAITRSAPGRER